MPRLGGALACVAAAACAGAPPYRVDVPLGLDLLAPVPAENPLTAAGVALGERLFFDRALSADGNVSCASCHRPEHAFADTIARSRGSHGRSGVRNAPSLLNAAYLDELFWDGRAHSLEEQVLMPLQDTLEMNRRLDDLERQLRRDASYRKLFRRAYGSEPNRRDVARALASYIRTLRSGNTRFDRFEAGDSTALSAEERQGRALFLGRARCHICHLGPRKTDGEYRTTGVAQGKDPGRYAVTGDSADLGAFRTPSLRNVGRTAPYMHDGSIATLEDVVAFYNRGGGPGAERTLRPLGLTADEQRVLVLFLRTLTE